MLKETIATKRDYKSIVKHNNLIKSRYTLDTSEQKLLYKIFEHVQRLNYNTKEIKISFAEFFKDFKSVLDKNITKADFKNTVESLQDKKVYIFNELDPDEFIRTQWYKIKGNINFEELTLILDDDVFKYIQSQEKNFTMLRLESIYSFKKAYTFKIYELVKQWANTKSFIEIKIEAFKENLDILNNTGYKNYSNIEKRIILPALEEINNKSELKLAYEPIKDGRKVIAIQFTVLKNRLAPKLENNNDDLEKLMEAPAKSFYIPEDSLLSTAVKRSFKREFKQYNFSIPEYEEAFYKAEEKVIERDNMSEDELIKSNQYELFKSVLLGNIATIEAQQKQSSSFIEDMNFYASAD